MTSLSRSTIYTKMNQQDFPKSISLSSRSVVWVRKELEDWIQNKMAERLND
ncbi:AlpA family phage regulatory protein [Shewanella schlegeliana]|nr:AlpA family phage regulatory protein [Shewanella schlegeliana]